MPRQEFGDVNVEVMPGEWGMAEHEGIISTADISTCIGISVYSPIGRVAIVGHFAVPDSIGRRSSLDGFFEFARGMTDAGDLNVWLGGGEIIDRADHPAERKKTIRIANDETMAFRHRTLQRAVPLLEKGGSLKTTWLKSGGSLHYSLELPSGSEHITVMPG